MTIRQMDAVYSVLCGGLKQYADSASLPEQHGDMVDWTGLPSFFYAVMEQCIEALEWGAKAPRSLQAATTRIAREVNAWRTHPAFQGLGVAHKETGWVFGFRRRDADVVPFIQMAHPGAEMVVLWPKQRRTSGGMITEWLPWEQPIEEVLPWHYGLAEHQRFETMVLAPHHHPSFQEST